MHSGFVVKELDTDKCEFMFPSCLQNAGSNHRMNIANKLAGDLARLRYFGAIFEN
jgi:hypothetical protein